MAQFPHLGLTMVTGVGSENASIRFLADCPKAHALEPKAPGQDPLEHGQVSGHAPLIWSSHLVEKDIPNVVLTS